MSSGRKFLNLSATNVFGALAFTGGFILTAMLLPKYLSGQMSPFLMLLPATLAVTGGILFVFINSDVDERETTT